MAKQRDTDEEAGREGLNEPQQRRVVVTFRHVDKLLQEIENIVTATPSPFARYHCELSPEAREAMAALVASLRQQLLSGLERLGVPLDPSHGDAVFAVRTMLTYAKMALEELRPECMGGYGTVPPKAAAALTTTVDNLSEAVRRFEQQVEALSQGAPAGERESSGED